ncbi:MAG TPA: vWA domain-containing protein [Gaiellaceae bacterium]|nr:vWA domain-containing protein [Gaiellaceae bacterium]
MRVRMQASVAGILVTLAAALVTAATAVAAPGVDPTSVSVTLAPGGSTTLTKTVHTPTIPPNADILFLADTTGSMGGAIANVRTNASSIMSQVLAAQPTSEFGAAEYKDVGDPFVYRLNQAITANTANVQTGINQWVASGGGDIPEAQVNALFTLATDPATAFRPGSSSRFVVWFGDAPGHDPSNGHTLVQAIAALQAAHVTVIAIPVSGGGTGLDSTGQATQVATATGGQVLATTNPTDVANAILAGLQNLPATVNYTTSCSPGLTVSLAPAPQTVPSGTDAVFTETISLSASPPAGALSCTVSFTINGSPGGPAFVETVHVNRPPVCSGASAGPDLWPPNHKLSAERSITGVTDADGNPVSITINSIFQDEPVNGLGDGNTSPDAVINGSKFQVRAERSGLGDGRVYYVNFTASDGAGGTCRGTATIGVPHDQAHDPVGGGQLFNSIP